MFLPIRSPVTYLLLCWTVCRKPYLQWHINILLILTRNVSYNKNSRVFYLFTTLRNQMTDHCTIWHIYAFFFVLDLKASYFKITLPIAPKYDWGISHKKCIRDETMVKTWLFVALRPISSKLSKFVIVEYLRLPNKLHFYILENCKGTLQ